MSVCRGQFLQIIEKVRFNDKTGAEEKFYVRSVQNVRGIHLMARPVTNKTSHLKTKGQVRELIDITDEAGAAEVHNLCDVIDLNDSDYEEDSSTAPIHASSFIKQPLLIFRQCTFCPFLMTGDRFAAHVDSCRGRKQVFT